MLQGRGWDQQDAGDAGGSPQTQPPNSLEGRVQTLGQVSGSCVVSKAPWPPG